MVKPAGLRMICVVLVLSHICAQIEVSPGSLEYRFDRSLLVCRGTTRLEKPCTAPEVNGKLQPIDCTVTVSVSSVYKGPSTIRHLRLQLPNVGPLSGLPVSEGKEYLFFLNPAADGKYFESSKTSGTIVDLTGLHFSTGGREGIEGLEFDVIDAAIHGDHARAALELLVEFEHLSPESLQRVQGLSSVNLEEALLKLTVLARSDPARYLPSLASTFELWTSANPLVDPSVPIIVPPGLLTIGDILARSTSSADIPLLERFAKSDQPYISVSAMQGLRRFKDPITIPFLIAQLDSKQSLVRYQGVITLAEIVGKSGDFGPGMGVFDKDETRYINLWKSWWREQKEAHQ